MAMLRRRLVPKTKWKWIAFLSSGLYIVYVVADCCFLILNPMDFPVMRNLLFALVVLITFGTPGALAQEEEDSPSWYPKEIENTPALAPKAKAKEMIKAFDSSYKKAVKEEDQLKVIKGMMDTARSPYFVKSLTKILTKSKSFLVRTEVANALGVIGSGKAETALIKVIRDDKNSGELEFLIAAGRALGKCSKKSRFKMLKNEFHGSDANVKRALVLSWGYAKDWNAIRLLGDWVQQPSPSNASSASNPPASYWQARHKEWRQIKRQVEWSLWSITGKVFYNRKEVKAFLKKHPKPPKAKKKRKLRR
ncbi:MAG: hypothetical protein ACI97A_000425 [Planctomycetota bacterium]|jgi:hypothetical protein